MMPPMHSALQADILAAQATRPPSGTHAAAIMTGIGFILSVAFGLVHEDGILHFDDLTHYLFARWAWSWPAYLLDDWGRPGFTVLYFLPAGLGWWACRVLSAALTAAAAFLAFRIAEGMNLRAAWAAVPLAYAQPLYFQLSQTTLTETPMAFYLTLAVWLAQRSRWSASAAVVSLTFITRHEAIVLLPVWLAAAHRAKVPLRSLWPILWAPLVSNVLAPLLSIRPTIALFLDPTRAGQYGRGGWMTYLCRTLEAWGPAVTVLAILGLRQLARSGGWLICASVVVSFAAQTIVRALGLYDSGGYARFLVPLSPLVAIAAVAGWQQLIATDAQVRRRAILLAGAAMTILWLSMERQIVLHAAALDAVGEIASIHLAKLAMRIATAVLVLLSLALALSVRVGRGGAVHRLAMPAALVGLMLLTVYALCQPLRPPLEKAAIAGALSRLDEMGLGDREIVSASIWLDHVTDRKLTPWRPSVRVQLEQAPVGTLFAWEPQFAASADHGLAREEFMLNPAFRQVLEVPLRPGHQSLTMEFFEKIAPWPH